MQIQADRDVDTERDREGENTEHRYVHPAPSQIPPQNVFFEQFGIPDTPLKSKSRKSTKREQTLKCTVGIKLLYCQRALKVSLHFYFFFFSFFYLIFFESHRAGSQVPIA